MMSASPYSVALPTRILFGSGSVRKLGEHAALLGRRAYILADPFLKGSGIEADITAQLDAAGIQWRIWHDIVPNPRAATCDAAARDAVDFRADLIIALGGGSTMDAAKAVSLVVTNGGASWNYTSRADGEVEVPTRRGLRLIAIPTNAGTGAEVTPFAVLSNPELKLKATIIHPFCYPDLALIDPDLHLTKPPRLTASTGVDTFLHAFEGYIGNRPNGWTDVFSLRAMELVAQYLPLACSQPGNLEARSQMAEACYMAGITLANIGVGIPHALGQGLGALKDTPHGESCAAFLISTVRWTLPFAEERMARVSRLFRPQESTLSVPQQAAALPDILTDFFEGIGMDGGLRRLGLQQSEIAQLVQVAQTNYGFDIACSQRQAGREDLLEIVSGSLEA